MNYVIIDMKDMSLSKEVYDSRPHSFFIIFVYGLLVMIAVALLWAYIGHIDIVVRAQGIIRPYGQMAQIINPIAGEVSEVHFHDGMQVEQGDILYILYTFHIENEAATIQERLTILERELTTLNLYLMSIEAGENLIGNFNEELSTRFDSFYVNLRVIEHLSINQNQLLSESLVDLQNNLLNVKFELDMLRTLEVSILNNTDMFVASDVDGRNLDVFNAYRNRFLNFIAESNSLNFQRQIIQEAVDGYTLIRDSIYHGRELFEEDNIYRGIYNEHMLQLRLLQERLLLAHEAYRRDRALYDAGIIPGVDLQEIEAAYNLARFNTEEHISAFDLRVNDGILESTNMLVDMNNRIEIFKLDTQVMVSNQILHLENTTRDLNQRVIQTTLQQETVFLLDEELGDVAINRLNEINMIRNQLGTVEQEILLLRAEYARLISQIQNSTVRAQIDGEINMHVEVVEGSFLMSGINILSIIPTREETLKANIFINNNDIASIEEGMSVVYDIPAMPSREFGIISGKIQRISPDTAMQDGLLGYFLVESLLKDKIYYDTRGNATTLRVGMHFEARIIVDRQRILFHLLDQVNMI